MEFEEAHNNLRAIRLLYRLLHDNNLRLRNEYSDDLIERARGLLKNLLDVAVVSVFQTHLKIIATQEGISKTSFEQEKHMAMLQSKSPVAANNSQISVKDPTLSKIIPQKDEKPQLKFISEKELPSRISDNGGTNSTLGEENSMMQHNLVKARDLSNQKGISPDKESSHYEEQHNNVDALDGVGEQGKESLQMLEEKVGESNEEKNIPLLSKIDEFRYNPSAARHVESPDQKGDFSDDLLKAMKRIESRVFALQLCSNLVDSTKNNADHQTMNAVANLNSANMQGKDETAGSQNHRLHNAVSAKSNDDTPKQIGNPLVSGGELTSQNRAQGLNKVKSFNRSVIGNTHLRSQATEASDHIQDLRVAMNQDNLTRKPSKLSSHANRKILVRKSPVTWSETDDNQKKRGPEHSYARKPVRSTDSTIARRQKPPPPHQMVIRPTLLDQRSSEIKLFSHHKREGSVLDKRETHKSGHDEPWKTRVQSQQYHEQEESSSNTQSSSSWTSQQDSGNSISNSEDYSLPSGTEGSTSGTMVDAAYEGSSEESNNSYTSKSNDDNPSQRFGSMKSHRYYPKRNAEKNIGGLKRLKNKLGLIFHHHHHHHHHHYDDDDDDDDDSNIQSKQGHNKHSVWNNLQHVFHRKNKHGVLTKRKVDKTRRGGGVARAVVPRGNQVGQFHRLVEGLLRHMRHSKEQKSHKLGEVKGSRDKPHGRHSKKKLHWWQMLQQRRGVKMKNKGRVKVGFISQKSPKKLT